MSVKNISGTIGVVTIDCENATAQSQLNPIEATGNFTISLKTAAGTDTWSLVTDQINLTGNSDVQSINIINNPNNLTVFFQSDAAIPQVDQWGGFSVQDLAASDFTNVVIRHATGADTTQAMRFETTYSTDNLTWTNLRFEDCARCIIYGATTAKTFGNFSMIRSKQHRQTIGAFHHTTTATLTFADVYCLDMQQRGPMFMTTADCNWTFDNVFIERCSPHTNQPAIFFRSAGTPVLTIDKFWMYNSAGNAGSHIAFFNYSVGTVTVSGGVYRSQGTFCSSSLNANVTFAGMDLYGISSNEINTGNFDDCFFAAWGGGANDVDLFSLQAVHTASGGTPDGIADLTVEPWGNVDSIVNPRSAPKFPFTFTGTLGAAVSGSQVTFTHQPNHPGVSYVVYGTTTQTVLTAPDLEGYDASSIPSFRERIDDSGNNKLIFDVTSRTLPIVKNLADGTYKARGAVETPFATVYFDGSEIEFTIDTADTTPPVFSGGVSGLAATDAATDGDVNLTWNTATDAGDGLEGYSIFHSTVEANVFSDLVKLIVPAGTESVTISNLTNEIEVFFGVRARDLANPANETTNTDTQSATPTLVSAVRFGPFILQQQAPNILVKDN